MDVLSRGLGIGPQDAASGFRVGLGPGLGGLVFTAGPGKAHTNWVHALGAH